MSQKRGRKNHLSSRKVLNFLLVGLFAVGLISYFGVTRFSADAATSTAKINNCTLAARIKSGNPFSCPALGAKLTASIETPFPSSNLSALPDGQSCAYVNLEALKSDGTFLENEPLVIVKPLAVSIAPLQNTGSGMTKLCFTTKKPIQARIIIKLKNLPKISVTFTLNFNAKYKIQNLTDRQSFQYNIPITFIAQIDPVLVPGLQKKTLSFIYTRRVNKWGMWRNEKRQVDANLDCTEDGRCTAVIGGTDVSTNRIVKGKFTYKFSFIATGNVKFYQTYTGQLR